MKAMGGGDLNMTDEELKQLVEEWRVASPNIVSLWHDIEDTAKTAIICKDTQCTHGLTFNCKSGMLFITLPSGRFLSYARPHFTKNRFGQTAIAYMGVGESKRWQEIETFGGKLTEMVGIDADGAITGIKVTDHADTPGVGTKAQAPGHLEQYVGVSELTNTNIKKDPAIDHVSGASVSSGAIHYGVYGALEQFKLMGGEL